MNSLPLIDKEFLLSIIIDFFGLCFFAGKFDDFCGKILQILVENLMLFVEKCDNFCKKMLTIFVRKC